MRAVVDYLAGLGHRRIALVLSQGAGRPMRRRVEGFHAGLAAHGITPHHRRSFGPVSQLTLALSVAPPSDAPALAQVLHDVLQPEASP
jgi:LacI family transcriptional regulator